MLVQNYGWPIGPAKIWLANRASQNMALAGPAAVWVASGQRKARPLVRVLSLLCLTLFTLSAVCRKVLY